MAVRWVYIVACVLLLFYSGVGKLNVTRCTVPGTGYLDHRRHLSGLLKVLRIAIQVSPNKTNIP